MTVLAVTNQKGGVAKTSTCIELASNLANMGYNVLAIDNDPQGNFSRATNPNNVPFYFGTVHNFYSDQADEYFAELDPNAEQITIEDLYAIYQMDAKERKITLATTCRWPIYRIGNKFDIVPAPENQLLSEVERTMQGARLKEALEKIDERFNYDFVIIDTPPALGILTANALIAANYALVPCNAEEFSREGMKQLHATFTAAVKYNNPGLKYAGILVTKTSSRTILHKSFMERLKEDAEKMGTKVFETTIPLTTVVPESQAMKQPLQDYRPKNAAAIQYEAFTKELLEVIQDAH